MALSLPAGSIQLPAQLNPLPEMEADIAVDGAILLFADALRIVASEADAAAVHADAAPTQEQSVTDAVDGADAVDAVDAATAETAIATDAALPGMAQPMLPVATRAPMPDMQAPLATAALAMTDKEGMEVTAAELIQLRRAGIIVRDAAFAPASPQRPGVDANGGVSGVTVRDAAFVPASPQHPSVDTDSGVSDMTVRDAAFAPASPQRPSVGTHESVSDTAHARVHLPLRSAVAPVVEDAAAAVAREHGMGTATASGSPAAATQIALAVNASVETTPDATLKLPAGTPQQWRQPLADALGERLRMQIGARSESAVIRLDPPMMGQIEIRIHHEAGILQVQLSASHGEVLRQLNHIGESLRQDLAQRQYTDVSVLVSSTTPDGRQRQRQPEAEREEPGRALAETSQEAAAFALLSDNA